jgi:membrane associated rhomboid family serine protease
MIGFMSNGRIDNFAHLGGLVGGILMTMALGVKYKSSKVERINGAIVSIVLTAFLFFIAFNYINFS